MKRIFFLIVSFIFAGCYITDPDKSEINQKFLFEYEYLNFAWGYSHEGFFIDNSGNIFSYKRDRDSVWHPEDFKYLKEQELIVKYHNKKLIGNVRNRELEYHFRLIDEAATGSYSDTVSVGADFGSISLICYQYLERNKKYKKIDLEVKGDYKFHNLSPEARIIAKWIDSLNSDLDKMKN